MPALPSTALTATSLVCRYRVNAGDPLVHDPVSLPIARASGGAAEQPSLSDSSSTGLSRFLLDTYDEHDGQSRPARYGAYVFGDRIPLNVTVDWDDIRENPEVLKRALELAGDVVPAEGGHYDVKVRRARSEGGG